MSRRFVRPSLAAIATSIVLFGCGGSGAGSGLTRKCTQTNLVSDTGGATTTDANLVNAWGVSFSPNGPFWISDNGTGVSTLYDGSGANQGLVVTIPAAGGGSNGPVSGQVFNGTASDFVIPSHGQSLFIFDSEDGLITACNSVTTSFTVADRSGTGAVYKGLEMAQNGGANFLYATNFNAGAVDVYDSTFTYSTSFTDVTIPAGYGPFGIANIGGLLYVTYAKQDPAKHDDVAGPGNGYVDVFNPNGTLNKRLVSRGALNSPWGLALAPNSFGAFGGTLLVGNFGDGHINAYNISTGASMGSLNNSTGQPLVIDGLWAIVFGNGAGAGLTSTLYFTAGPGGESHG